MFERQGIGMVAFETSHSDRFFEGSVLNRPGRSHLTATCHSKCMSNMRISVSEVEGECGFELRLNAS